MDSPSVNEDEQLLIAGGKILPPPWWSDWSNAEKLAYLRQRVKVLAQDVELLLLELPEPE